MNETRYKHVITVPEKPELNEEENEFLKMIWDKGKIVARSLRHSEQKRRR